MRWDRKETKCDTQRSSTVACGRRLGCDGERKEVSVIAIDVMKGLCDSRTDRTAQYSRERDEREGGKS